MNYSQTEQISRHLPTGPANDANFVQSTQKEEFFLNQAANLRRDMNHVKFAQFMLGQV